ncbi:MAG: hypothetical protein IJS69_04280, partial [Selenomonadaceae bacterium]|nr:hypothetical protein [Selenomonadaceae bacterium]
MAFKLDDMGVSSSAGLTLAEFDSAHAGTLSSYARVVAISGNQVTINSNTSMQFDGVYGKFEVGADVLFHVTATASATYKKYLGCYCVATITAVNGYTLTLDKDVTKVIPASEFGRYYVQLISFARFESLNLKSGVQIVPPAYSTTNFYGGIVAIKVFGDMTLSGGHINLTDRGIPVSATSIRPLTTQETNGTLDTDKYSGWENAQTKDRFLLNCGDGAAFILVYGTLNRSGSASRIGNPSTYGVQCCRGASDSVSIGTKPENITNVGGSTILIAAKNFSNFAPALIAKYRSTSSATGQGLCRAYIASDTTLGNDEGLYSYDCIANKGTISEINIRSFGTGEFGTCNTTAQLNNYAQITLLSPDCKTVTYTGKTTNGIAKIQKGALVMLHASQKAYAGTDTNPGKFTLAHVLEDTGSTLKLDFPAPNLDPTKYVMQVVSIPQYSSFAQNNSATLKFNGVKGGIFAVAVNGTCDLTGKQILVEAKGGGTAYGKP